MELHSVSSSICTHWMHPPPHTHTVSLLMYTSLDLLSTCTCVCVCVLPAELLTAENSTWINCLLPTKISSDLWIHRFQPAEVFLIPSAGGVKSPGVMSAFSLSLGVPLTSSAVPRCQLTGAWRHFSLSFLISLRLDEKPLPDIFLLWVSGSKQTNHCFSMVCVQICFLCVARFQCLCLDFYSCFLPVPSQHSVFAKYLQV